MKSVSCAKSCEERFMQDAGYADEVCDRIDTLLKEYSGENYAYVGLKPIQRYLQECLKFYENMSFESVADISRSANMASSEDLYKLLEEIHNTWKGLSR